MSLPVTAQDAPAIDVLIVLYRPDAALLGDLGQTSKHAHRTAAVNHLATMLIKNAVEDIRDSASDTQRAVVGRNRQA